VRDALQLAFNRFYEARETYFADGADLRRATVNLVRTVDKYRGILDRSKLLSYLAVEGHCAADLVDARDAPVIVCLPCDRILERERQRLRRPRLSGAMASALVLALAPDAPAARCSAMKPERGGAIPRRTDRGFLDLPR